MHKDATMELQLENRTLIEAEIVQQPSDMLHILIFCTSLSTSEDVQKIAHIIESFPGIISWSVDLEDCDKVLRVVADGNITSSVIHAFQEMDINIQEMPDQENTFYFGL